MHVDSPSVTSAIIPPMTAPPTERTIVAFLDGPDSLDVPNIIHSTEGATAYGYRGALVGGVTVYGWTVPAIVEALDERWLDDGWVDVHFRRPVYPGDCMTARVAALSAGKGHALAMTNGDGAICLEGPVGLGRASWFGDITLPARRTPEPRPEQLPELTLETAPVGCDLRPMAVPVSPAEAVEYALEKQLDAHERWTGTTPRIHPGWLAGRMTRLIHYSFDYGPSIHTRSQIQHLSPAFAGQTLTVAGRFVEAFERNGHHYAVVDGLILAEGGHELARLRHTTIFRVARR